MSEYTSIAPDDFLGIEVWTENVRGRGWRLVPVTHPDAVDKEGRALSDAGKRPPPSAKHWQHRQFTGTDFATYAKKHEATPNVGIRLDGLQCFDVDADDEATANRLISAASAILPPGSFLVRIGRPPRASIVFRTADPMLRKATSDFPVDLRGGSGMFMVSFGIHPKTRAPFRWEHGSPANTWFVDLPVIPRSAVLDCAAAMRAAIGLPPVDEPEAEPSTRPSTPRETAPTRKAGKLRDGRRELLRDLAWEVCNRWKASGRGLDPNRIAAEVMLRFCERADLAHPKGNGTGSWGEADVRWMVAATIRSKKFRDSAGLVSGRFWTAERKAALLGPIQLHKSEAFRLVAREIVRAARDERGLSYLSISTLMEQTGLSKATVTRHRRQFIELGFGIEVERGTRKRSPGGQGKPTVIQLNPAMVEHIEGAEAAARAEAVDVLASFPAPREIPDHTISNQLRDKRKIANLDSELIQYTSTTSPARSLPPPPPLQLSLLLPITSKRSAAHIDVSAPLAPIPSSLKNVIAYGLTGDPECITANRSEIGEALRTLRWARGWSQAELAALAGIRQPHLANVERGHDSASAPALRTMFRALLVAPLPPSLIDPADQPEARYAARF